MNKRELLEKWNSKLRQYQDVANNDTVPKVLRSDARRQVGAILRFLQDLEKLNEGILESEITSEKFEQTPMSGEILAASNKVVTDILFG